MSSNKFLEKTVHNKTYVTIRILSYLIHFNKHYVKANKNKMFPITLLFHMYNEDATGCKSDASGLDSRSSLCSF